MVSTEASNLVFLFIFFLTLDKGISQAEKLKIPESMKM